MSCSTSRSTTPTRRCDSRPSSGCRRCRRNEREDIEMRKKALFWAGQSGANLDQLVALYDRVQNQDMKEQLVFVYSQRREPAALDKLIDIARREQNRELRKKALFWIGQSHDPRAAKVLEEIINQ